MSIRRGSRLETDDPHYCKWCGKKLPDMMVDGPIAGGDSEYAPVELCGECKAEQMLAAASDGTEENTDA